MKIGIIGGTKGLGKTLACYLKHDNFDVTITGRDEKVGKKVSHKLNVKYTSNNLEVAENVDILIISVPIHVTINIIKELAPHMKKGSLLMDVTSVKTQATYTMNKYIPEGVESIPTHPVFGPRTPGFEGQVIVLTPLKKGKWYPKIYNYFKSKNMRIIETDCKHHDNMMGIVQVLTHFSYIST
ncbi:MAG: prephenate dehydrogenase/arogenate dehydrogenase family protein, partial [Methanobrevibacter wolinii]